MPAAYDFRDLKAPRGFRNINEIGDLSAVDWLHPVQSLYGDWSGRGMILGQDYNSWENVKNLKISQLTHDESFETNKNIRKVFGEDFKGIYANYFWFIKDGRNASSYFSTRKEVIDANEIIFKSTIEHMENLKTIFCLGSKVYQSVFRKKYTAFDSHKTTLFGKGLEIVALPHLGGLGMTNFCRQHSVTRSLGVDLVRKFVRTKI